ncbi:MAG: ribosome recycling factor [Actinobacteria bacterium]|nr:ribosome recycling factor [Actinomycetota bacterium]
MKDALLVDAKIRMHQSLERTQHEFNTIRTGRASVSLLDNIYIDYYGSKTLLKHISNVSIPEPRAILISPYEPKFLKEIETQISKSDMGINPSNNGKVIRLNVPPLNEERRKELVKLVRKIAEDGKVAIRNIRREINDEFKKLESGSKITEDDLINSQKEVQEVTDEFIEKIDDSLAQKEKEIMEV